MDAPLAVIGAGSWGTGLAIHLAGQGHTVRLWSRNAEHAQSMARERRNPKYLSDIAFPASLEPTSSLEQAVAGARLIVCAIPSHGMRDIVRQLRPILERQTELVPDYLIASKGVEVETLNHMHDVLEQELPESHRSHIAVLGGPSFADEVARGLPTTVVVAARNPGVRTRIQNLISDGSLRAYETDDVLGVELGGAFKNVIALAAGVCDGAGLGNNARAGLMTRGLAEITRLAVALGGHPATLSGLAGMGDLVLTCTGGLSRNRRVGLELGQGHSLDEILARMGMVAEGVRNTQSAFLLAKQVGVDMPIVNIVHGILYRGVSVDEAVAQLMGRKLKSERA